MRLNFLGAENQKEITLRSNSMFTFIDQTHCKREFVNFASSNFNIRGNYSQTYNDISYKLIHVLVDIGMQVFGAYYDGNEVSVRIFCKIFYEGINA